MERPKRKAINFDLDTNAMKERTIYPVGYELLRLSFEERGFYHRQGSGYISIEKMTHSDVNFIIKSITEENLWLADCVKRIDVTDIGKQYDPDRGSQSHRRAIRRTGRAGGSSPPGKARGSPQCGTAKSLRTETTCCKYDRCAREAERDVPYVRRRRRHGRQSGGGRKV